MALGFALALSGVAMIDAPANAGDQCSLATLKGDYLYAQDGIIPGNAAAKNQFFCASRSRAF